MKWSIGTRIGDFTIVERRGTLLDLVCDYGHERTISYTNISVTKQCRECFNAMHGPARERYAYLHLLGNAKRRGYAVTLTKEQHAAIVVQDCTYCGIPASPKHGVDRRENSEGYTPENSVPCCSVCNFAKRDMPADHFIAWAKRVAAHNP